MSRLSRPTRQMKALIHRTVREAVAEAIETLDLPFLAGELDDADEDVELLTGRVAELEEIERERDAFERLANTWKWNAESCGEQLGLARSEVAAQAAELTQERALSAKLEGDLERALEQVEALKRGRDARAADAASLRIEIARLKAAKSPCQGGPSPQPSPLARGEGAVGLTPLVEQIRDLIGKGHSDRGICDIVNNRLEPPQWLNAGGVRAIRELLVGGAA